MNRRRLLGAVASGLAVGLAGCSQLDDEGSELTRFVVDDVEPILSEPLPEVPRAAPVEPDPEAIEAERENVEQLLDPVPDTVTADDVPNGVIREGIQAARDGAEESLREAESDDLALDGLRETRTARRQAREANVAYGAIDGDVTREELDDERRERTAALDRRLDERAYVGEDPHRTLSLAHRIETDRYEAKNRADRFQRGEDNVLRLGEFAAEVEFAAATLDVTDHLDKAHEERLDDSQSFTEAFEEALDESLDRTEEYDRLLDDEPAELVDADIEDDHRIETVLWEGSRDVDTAASRMRDAAADGHLGRGLYWACAFEVRALAYERLLDAIDDGEYGTVEEIDDLRTVREDAVGRLHDALDVPSEDSVGHVLLRGQYERLTWTDEALDRRVEQSGEASMSLNREYRTYVWTAEQLDAVSEGVTRFEDRIDRVA